MINASPPSEMSRQSSERRTEASTPFPQEVANRVNIVIVVLITDDGDVDVDDDGDVDVGDDGDVDGSTPPEGMDADMMFKVSPYLYDGQAVLIKITR